MLYIALGKATISTRFAHQSICVGKQDALRRAEKAASEVERLKGQLAAMEAAVAAGNPAAASAAQQQVLISHNCLTD